jgi:hypothetical protein
MRTAAATAEAAPAHRVEQGAIAFDPFVVNLADAGVAVSPCLVHVLSPTPRPRRTRKPVEVMRVVRDPGP